MADLNKKDYTVTVPAPEEVTPELAELRESVHDEVLFPDLTPNERALRDDDHRSSTKTCVTCGHKRRVIEFAWSPKRKDRWGLPARTKKCNYCAKAYTGEIQNNAGSSEMTRMIQRISSEVLDTNGASGELLATLGEEMGEIFVYQLWKRHEQGDPLATAFFMDRWFPKVTKTASQETKKTTTIESFYADPDAVTDSDGSIEAGVVVEVRQIEARNE